MKALKARVVKGRLVMDQPCRLPDGTELDLQVADDGDDLTPKERAALHAALDAAWKSVKAGRTIPADQVLRKLAKRR